MDADGGRGGLGGGAPDVFHELQTGKYLVGVGEKLVEQAKFLLGQDLLPAVGGDGEGVVVQGGFSDDQLVLGDDLCPAEKGFDPKREFLGIEGLRDVIVHTGEEAFFNIGGLFSGGKHEDGEVIFAVPKEFGEGEPIHAGKGCLQHHEVDAAFFQGMERLPGGTGGKSPVAGIREEERERPL